MAVGSPRFVAPERTLPAPASRPIAAAPAAKPGPGGAVPLVGGGRLPLAFIAMGLVAFGAAAAWLAHAARAGFPPFLHPEVVAVAHLWLPGFLLSVCFGATYQLMPVVLGTPLRTREPWLWAHAGLHVAGVAALVWGLAGGRYLWAGLGGSAIALGTVLLGAVTWKTFRHSSRRDAPAWSFVFSAGWLLATVLAGVLMAMNRRHAFLPLSTVDLLRAHAHLGLVGYFATLLQGVTFQLVPMFTMGEARRPRVALAGLLATQAGLPVLAAGLALGGRGAVAVGAGLLTVAAVATGLALTATLASRRRRRLDMGVRAFVVGMALLGIGGIGGLGMALGGVGPEGLFAGAAAYGLWVVAGGLSLAVLGMLAKILPFLVWMRAYGPRVGKEAVPVATSLSSRGLEALWLGLHLAGLAGLSVGALSGTRWPATGGAGLLAAGALAWLINAGRVSLHLRKAAPPFSSHERIH